MGFFIHGYRSCAEHLYRVSKVRIEWKELIQCAKNACDTHPYNTESNVAVVPEQTNLVLLKMEICQTCMQRQGFNASALRALYIKYHFYLANDREILYSTKNETPCSHKFLLSTYTQ